jgi:hypothetical protein
MASEELLAKRFLRLTGYLKDTREPRGSEHMAKMKAARDTHIASMIRYAFERSGGKPVSTAQLVEEIYGWQLRLQGKAKQSYHYEAIRRALRKVATPIDKASTRGRSVLWKPDERLELRSWKGRAARKRKRQCLPPISFFGQFYLRVANSLNESVVKNTTQSRMKRNVEEAEALGPF